MRELASTFRIKIQFIEFLCENSQILSPPPHGGGLTNLRLCGRHLTQDGLDRCFTIKSDFNTKLATSSIRPDHLDYFYINNSKIKPFVCFT